MRLSAIWQFFYSDPMRYSMGGEKRVFAAHTRRRRAEKGIDNTPDLPPFTSPFNYVIIFTISKLCRLKRGGFRLGSCRAISIFGGGRMGLMKYCNRTGCNRLVPQGVKYCAAHTVGKTAENRQRHKEYDAHCRNQTAKDFYNSTEWKAARAQALARDTNIDIYLYIMEGRIVPADTVHHIVELMEDYSKRCDMDNLISISEATHSMISKAYKDAARKAAMQQTLRECIREYKRRLAG